MKKSLALICAFVIALSCVSVPVFAGEVKNIEQTETVSGSQSDGEISPRIIHRYEKTVVNIYSEYPVPASINYREYNMDSWFSGTLYLKKVEAYGKQWRATYSGTLTGVI